MDGRYSVASCPLLYISICIFNPLCQCVVCNLPWTEFLWVGSLHAQSGDPMDQRRIDGDASIYPYIATMEARQQDINACFNLLVPSKMWYLHYIQDSGLCEVHSPWLGDYPQVLPLCPSQIPMRRDHIVVLSIP
jgi:hypothetical protein